MRGSNHNQQPATIARQQPAQQSELRSLSEEDPKTVVVVRGVSYIAFLVLMEYLLVLVSW